MSDRWVIAERQAVRLVRAVPGQLATALAEDTFDALRGAGFVVRFRSEQDSAERCSVSGSYSPGPPPTITVAASLSERRRRFSALHEYGHHLIRADVPIHDLFVEQADGGEAMEEDVCDAVASELLLPNPLVDQFIGNRGPTARSILDLFQASHASREAVCVRAAQRLLGEGYVMVGEGTVARFTASVAPYRIGRTTDQGPDSVLAEAARAGSARRQTHPRFRTGNEGQLLFADAVADSEGYTFAVLTDSPAWEDFTVRDADDLYPEYEGSCAACDIDFTTKRAPCQRCGETFCYRCGACSCSTQRPPVKEKTCPSCTMPRPLNLFEGDSEVCRDCV